MLHTTKTERIPGMPYSLSQLASLLPSQLKQKTSTFDSCQSPVNTGALHTPQITWWSTNSWSILSWSSGQITWATFTSPKKSLKTTPLTLLKTTETPPRKKNMSLPQKICMFASNMVFLWCLLLFPSLFCTLQQVLYHLIKTNPNTAISKSLKTKILYPFPRHMCFLGYNFH